MALTQQLARVTLEYLGLCRETALSAVDGDPHWDPPDGDTLDLDWAIWELLTFYRCMRPGDRSISVIERSIEGDTRDEIGFLDHLSVYDGFGDPPALVTPTAVAEVADELAMLDIEPLLRTLPEYRTAGGFAGSSGDPHTYLVEHFAQLRNFYETAAARGLAVVVWTD
ncbi:hypothetical protein GCM10022254_45710 [Actinomadura meridiana]|uniref:DUF1877 family protein n=1 Tax=Actinomadura meridiana TaxID=559626 RepID=A0ABP8CA06_9ACTN